MADRVLAEDSRTGRTFWALPWWSGYRSVLSPPGGKCQIPKRSGDRCYNSSRYRYNGIAVCHVHDPNSLIARRGTPENRQRIIDIIEKGEVPAMTRLAKDDGPIHSDIETERVAKRKARFDAVKEVWLRRADQGVKAPVDDHIEAILDAVETADRRTSP